MGLPHLSRRQTQQAYMHNQTVCTQIPPSSKCMNLTLFYFLALTVGGNVTTLPSGSPCAPVGTPTIQVLPPQPEPAACEDPAPVPTCTSHIPSVTSHVQGVLPQAKPTPSPDIDMVWAEALKLASEKLGDNNLPLYLTNLSSQLPGGNIRAVIEALDCLQKAEKDKRLYYTWNGKKVVIVERLGRFLKIAEPYSKIVDTAIQSNPEVAALVWAGVWAIMRVCIHLRCQLTGAIYTDSMIGHLESCGDDRRL